MSREKEFILPCNIGDYVFVVRDYKFCNPDCVIKFDTKCNHSIAIEPIKVGGFLFECEEISVIEADLDNLQIVNRNRTFSLNGKVRNAKVFYTYEEAMKFVRPFLN